MKKILSLLLLLVLSVFTVACSQSSPTETASTTSTEKEEAKPSNDFPNKTIEMVVPTPPGGGADTLARILAQHANKYLPNGQNVVIVNKPGGNATIGVSEIFKAKPDGYTIGFVPTGPITEEPHYGNTPYTHDSFQTIMRISQQDGLFYVRSDSPWQTYEEWLQYVKENPGKFRVGTIASTKYTLERLNHDAEIDMKIVPYEGFAETTTALLGKHVEGIFSIPTAVKAQLQTGEFKPLFSSSSRDVGVPLLKDNGFNISEAKVNGIIAPKGIPEDVLTILHDAFKKTLEDPEVVEQFRKVDSEPYYAGPEEYQQILTDGFEQSGETLRILGYIK